MNITGKYFKRQMTYCSSNLISRRQDSYLKATNILFIISSIHSFRVMYKSPYGDKYIRRAHKSPRRTSDGMQTNLATNWIIGYYIQNVGSLLHRMNFGRGQSEDDGPYCTGLRNESAKVPRLLL